MRSFLIFAAALVASAPAAAVADDLVVAIAAEGDYAVLARSNSESAAASSGFSLADASNYDGAGLAQCLKEGGSCRDLSGAAPAALILLVQVAPRSDDDVQVIARLVQRDDAQLRAVDQRICEACTSRERLARLVAEVVEKVLGDYLAERAPDTFLRIEGAPPGALLTIDGVARGEALGTHRVRPGEHTIAVEKNGYARHQQTVMVRPREQRLVRVDLRTDPTGEEEPSDTTFRTPLGYGLIGLGVAGAVAGGLWVATDGAESERGVRQQQRTDSAGLGYGTIVLGAAAVATGVVLILTDSAAEDGAERSSSLSLGPAPGGMSVGLRGAF